jgi:hypothetical protein
MRLNSKHFFLLLIGICSLAVTGFGYWYVYKSVIVNSQNRASLIREIEIDKENKKNEEFLTELSKATESDRTKLSTYFISEDDILSFITAIESTEKISSTTVVISSISNDTANNHIKANIDIKGGWINVRKALSMIENLPYSINIDSMNLNFDSSNRWNMTLGIRALSTK